MNRLAKHVFMLVLILGCLLACVQMPNDYRLADTKRFTTWKEIQKEVVVCMDSGGYAQLHRVGNEPVQVWCFNN